MILLTALFDEKEDAEPERDCKSCIADKTGHNMNTQPRTLESWDQGIDIGLHTRDDGGERHEQERERRDKNTDRLLLVKKLQYQIDECNGP